MCCVWCGCKALGLSSKAKIWPQCEKKKGKGKGKGQRAKGGGGGAGRGEARRGRARKRRNEKERKEQRRKEKPERIVKGRREASYSCASKTIGISIG